MNRNELLPASQIRKKELPVNSKRILHLRLVRLTQISSNPKDIAHTVGHLRHTAFANPEKTTNKKTLYYLEGLVRDGLVKKINEKFRLSDHEIVRVKLLASRKS